jgi:hypothetical protein
MAYEDLPGSFTVEIRTKPVRRETPARTKLSKHLGCEDSDMTV